MILSTHRVIYQTEVLINSNYLGSHTVYVSVLNKMNTYISCLFETSILCSLRVNQRHEIEIGKQGIGDAKVKQLSSIKAFPSTSISGCYNILSYHAGRCSLLERPICFNLIYALHLANKQSKSPT